MERPPKLKRGVEEYQSRTASPAPDGGLGYHHNDGVASVAEHGRKKEDKHDPKTTATWPSNDEQLPGTKSSSGGPEIKRKRRKEGKRHASPSQISSRIDTEANGHHSPDIQETQSEQGFEAEHRAKNNRALKRRKRRVILSDDEEEEELAIAGVASVDKVLRTEHHLVGQSSKKGAAFDHAQSQLGEAEESEEDNTLADEGYEAKLEYSRAAPYTTSQTEDAVDEEQIATPDLTGGSATTCSALNAPTARQAVAAETAASVAQLEDTAGDHVLAMDVHKSEWRDRYPKRVPAYLPSYNMLDTMLLPSSSSSNSTSRPSQYLREKYKTKVTVGKKAPAPAKYLVYRTAVKKREHAWKWVELFDGTKLFETRVWLGVESFGPNISYESGDWNYEVVTQDDGLKLIYHWHAIKHINSKAYQLSEEEIFSFG